MATYLLAAPILSGKTETWRKYVQEMRDQRNEEWNKSRQRAGLEQEQVWLEKTPQGDMAVVRYEGNNASGVFEHLLKSKDPFDIWFREKILVECHGIDPSMPAPPKNEMIFDKHFSKVGEKKYEETHKGR